MKNDCITLFTSYFIPWIHNFAKNNYPSVISPLSIKDGHFWLSIVTSLQLICDVTRTSDTGIVTSYSSIVLARANWYRDDFYYWITSVNIDFSPPGNRGLVCKKASLSFVSVRSVLLTMLRYIISKHSKFMSEIRWKWWYHSAYEKSRFKK